MFTSRPYGQGVGQKFYWKACSVFCTINLPCLQLKFFCKLATTLQSRLTLPSFYPGLPRKFASDARFELFQTLPPSNAP